MTSDEFKSMSQEQKRAYMKQRYAEMWLTYLTLCEDPEIRQMVEEWEREHRRPDKPPPPPTPPP